MKTIKATTKKGRDYIARYNRTTETSLHDCYKNPSTAKTRADYFCRQQAANENGNGYKIISFNTFGFSCAWRIASGLRIETPSNSYLIAE